MVIRGKTSKCGNLLITPRALATLSPPPDASPHHARRRDFPLPRATTTFPLPLPLGRFGQHDASPAIQPVFHPTTCRDWTTSPSLYFHSHQAVVRSPPLGKARCSRMRAPDACVRALARVRWCASVRVIIIRREQLYEEPTASDPFTLC